MPGPRQSKVADLLVAASTGVVAADEHDEAWNYGWCSEGYRRSPEARVDTARGKVRLTAEAVEHLAAAMAGLSKDGSIRDRWDLEELWGTVASQVAYLGTVEDAGERRSERRLRRRGTAAAWAPAAGH